MKCIGRTRLLKKCRLSGNRFFCHHHRFQPWILGLSIITFTATLGGLYQDIIKPLTNIAEKSGDAPPEPRVITVVIKLEDPNSSLSAIADSNRVDLALLLKAIEKAKISNSPLERAASALLEKRFDDSVEYSTEAISKLGSQNAEVFETIGNAHRVKSLGLFGLHKPDEALEEAKKAWEFYTLAKLPNLTKETKVVSAALLYEATDSDDEAEARMLAAGKVLGTLIENNSNTSPEPDLIHLFSLVFIMPGLGVFDEGLLNQLASSNLSFSIYKQATYKSPIAIGQKTEINLLKNTKSISDLRLMPPFYFVDLPPKLIQERLEDLEEMAKILDQSLSFGRYHPTMISLNTNLSQLHFGFGNRDAATVYLKRAVDGIINCESSGLLDFIILSWEYEKSYPQMVNIQNSSDKPSDWSKFISLNLTSSEIQSGIKVWENSRNRYQKKIKPGEAFIRFSVPSAHPPSNK